MGHEIEMNETFYVWVTGRGARFIGDMHGVESDEVSILCHSVVVFFCALTSASQSILILRVWRGFFTPQLCVGLSSLSVVSYLPFIF